MSIEVGNTIKGVVTGITDFGAFVELDDGKTGLIHISEVADTYVKDVGNFLEKDEKVKVKVISVDGDGKIGLSLKQLESKSNNKRSRRVSKESFEDKLSQFMQDSNRRQQELQKSLEDKRGSSSRSG